MTDDACDAGTSTGSNREDKGCSLSGLEVEGKREKSNGNNGDEKEILPSRIGIGSCNSQNLTQPLWNVLSQRNLSAFVWAGDAIYADHFLRQDWSKFPPEPIYSSATPQRLANYYAAQSSNADYQAFLQRKYPKSKQHPTWQQKQLPKMTVFGTIDDHDMGCNNGDKDFIFGRESGIAFLDFTGESHDSPIYQRALKGYGVYGVKLFDFARLGNDGGANTVLVSDMQAGIDPDYVSFDDAHDDIAHMSTDDSNPTDTITDESSTSDTKAYAHIPYSNKTVAVFVLDVRTNRTPWGKGFASWKPNYSGDFLGERQWKWFETAIRRSNASLNVIVTGLQVHPYRFPAANSVECWANFPNSRQRFYDAILQSGVKAPLILSGDVHMAQFMRKDCFRATDFHANTNKNHHAKATHKIHRRPLIEITTSGMTHSWGTVFASNEKFHKSWRYYYMHFVSKTFMSLMHFILPMPDLITSTHHHRFENGGAEGSKRGKQYALQLNAGELEFDWDQRSVIVRVHGPSNKSGEPQTPLLSAAWTFDQLSGLEEMPGGTAGTVRHLDMVRDYGRLQLDGSLGHGGTFVCTNHRMAATPLQMILGYVTMLFCFFILVLSPHIVVLCILRHFRRQKLLIRPN